MRQGDAADALYLVASGRFAVDVDGRRIAEVGSGSPIGEIGFFADGIRTATVTALATRSCSSCRKAEFVAFAERHPIILKPIAVTLARRLADTLAGDEQSLTHPRTHCRDRCRALGRAGSVSPRACPRALPLRPDRDRRFRDPCRGLAWRPRPRLRSRHELVQQAGASLPLRALFRRRRAYPVQPPRPSARPTSCLLVGRCNGRRPPPEAERAGALRLRHPSGLGPPARAAHDAREPISGTSRWLDARPVAMHHHLVAEDSAGYDRLARFVSGNASGFVACGGGALCAAHIGVYKASSRRISASICSAARAAAAPWPRPSPWARRPTRSAPAPPRFSWKRGRSSD